MGSVCIILRKPPYGTVEAPEAIRHALGGVAEEMQVSLVLVDGGVWAAKKDQQTEGTEYDSVEEGIKDCIDMGVEVYADKGSVNSQQLAQEDLIEGVRIVGSYEISEVVKDADTVMIF